MGSAECAVIVDISPLLTLLPSITWDLPTALAVAGDLACLSGLSVDHDQGAGEAWIRLVSETDAFAYIHTLYRVVIAAPGLLVGPRMSELVILLSVPLDAQCMTATVEALDSAFPGSSSNAVFSTVFSADDLWYATV